MLRCMLIFFVVLLLSCEARHTRPRLVRSVAAAPQQASSCGSSPSNGCGGYPFCSSARFGTDADGWGWENARSCIVKNSRVSAEKCGSGSVQPQQGSSDVASGCPSSLQCPPRINCGCYSIFGLGARKREVAKAGGISFLASAMMETDTLDANSYAHGDNKVGDSFNAGIAKQNWFLAKQCWSAWSGLPASAYETMSVLNNDLSFDAKVYNACLNKFGVLQFMAAHRNGQTGFEHPRTCDIETFVAGFEWTKRWLSTGPHSSNDLRFWVQLQAI